MNPVDPSAPEQLDEYHRKRDFGRTPEPRGTPGAEGGIFVVQKHAASHLHYDFRLELDGVLKSWAVPKGPSFDPSVKRLAMHVEDHPLDYAGFEGTIPKGEYGGGTVMVWDSGYWIPEGDPHAALRKGTLKFSLVGTKLHGRWVLVREKQPRQQGKEGWLLIKERDDFASTADVTHLDRSSATGRSMEEIAAAAGGVWTREHGAEHPETLVETTITGAVRQPMPGFISPQLATLVREVPDGPLWVNEIKHDGYRLLCRIDAGTVRILTRQGNDWTAKFPDIADALRRLPVNQAWLDGEAVVILPSGASSFEALQEALSLRRSADIFYFAFDLLYLNGFDLRNLPLVRRKELLRPFLVAAAGSPLRYSDHLTGSGSLFLRTACSHEVEGIVSKRADSTYTSSRNRTWLKVKCHNRQEFVICGFTDPGGGRQGFGALVIAAHDAAGRLVYAGRVGTGFNEETLRLLHARLMEREIEGAPVASAPTGREARDIHWVRPELVAEIEYAEITREGVLRHPSFKGLREDRAPSEVVFERPEPIVVEESIEAASPEPPGGETEAAIDRFRLTNPEKILYPEITKQDLAVYYIYIYRRMMPHLANRPLTLVRCPEGWNTECFFQKHAYDNVPAAVRRITIEEEEGVEAVYLAVETLEGLLSLVQMGILEIHTWGSRYDRLEYPDRIVFDLDPDEGLPWERLAEAALLVRNRLLDLRLESFVKTTGGKGFHIVVPVLPERNWEEVKEFSRRFAERLSRDYPDRFTPKMTKDVRTGRIFLDWMRNIRGATSVEVYSTRRKEAATVSVPVGWDEIAAGISVSAFTVKNIGSRFAALDRDPWEGYFEVKQSIEG